MAKKRIICRGHGPLNAGPHYRTVWDDVWLSWKGKPGRRTYRAAPCLMTEVDLDQEIVSTQELILKYPDIDWADELHRLLTIKSALAVSPYVTDMHGRFPDTWTRAEYIDRAEAERMLRHMLACRYHVTGPVKFIWRKPCKLDGRPFFVQSI